VANKPVVERRKYPRFRSEVLAAIEREDSPNVVAYAVDLSLGGIRFRYLGTGSEFPVESLVRMSLKIGDEDASVTGKVMRIEELASNAHELALSFVELEAGVRALLEDRLEDAEEAG